MADNNIKIYHSRYSKLIKLLDFLTVNVLIFIVLIFIYLKYFILNPQPLPRSLELSIH